MFVPWICQNWVKETIHWVPTGEVDTNITCQQVHVTVYTVVQCNGIMLPGQKNTRVISLFVLIALQSFCEHHISKWVISSSSNLNSQKLVVGKRSMIHTVWVKILVTLKIPLLGYFKDFLYNLFLLIIFIYQVYFEEHLFLSFLYIYIYKM